jgi:preprotein translocase subunit SecD
MRRLLMPLLIIVLALLAGYATAPNNGGLHIGWLDYNNDLRLREGLDLQGGIQFVLQAKCPASSPHCDIGSLIDATVQNINERINGGLGVSSATVTYQKDPTSGNYYISVQLPGVKDDASALSLLDTQGELDFIDTQGTQLQVGSTVTPGQYKILYTGKDLNPSSINVSFNSSNQPQIDFEMQGSALSSFATYTANNIGQYLTITLDNTVIESAVIESQITGQGEISGGSMTLAQAQNIAQILKYGALPLTLTPSSERLIDATLGAQAITDSLRAAVIGLGLVVLFMLIYYRLPGLVAVVALGLYATLLIALIKLLGVVLTLAGIAGVILSVGMAVDANVLIFERIKEELRGGRTLNSAISIGWQRAWPSIRDSNASTIITCLILAYFGNNFGATIIVGFATNLLIGVLTSLFTAVVVTRTLLDLLVTGIPGVIRFPWLFGLPKDAITVPTFRRPQRTGAGPVRPALAGTGQASLSDEDVEE